MLIRRENRGPLIAFACACAAHASLVAWMSSVDRAAAIHEIARRPEHVGPPPVAPTPTVVRLPPDADAVGEKTGEGESIASVDLPNEAQSPQPREVEQAWTRQEPTLTPPESPREQAAPTPQATPLGPVAPQVVMPPAPALPREVSPEGTIAAEKEPRREEQRPEEPAEKSTSDDAAASPQPQPAETPSATPAVAPPPSPPSKPPDAGEQGESDLDAFAKAEGVDFTRGGIQARTGRAVKLVRPRIDLGFMADVTTLNGRKSVILLRIETDAAGKPSRVDVLRSSGSKQIDDAIRLAMFSSWFGGKMPDAFDFGLTLWN